MLTPQDISDKVLVKAVFGGYAMAEVDDFIEAVAADYAALYKENAILKSKIKVLVEKVEEYRSTEDAMRMALLTAQRMGEDILSDANGKKAEVLAEADRQIKAKLEIVEKKIASEALRLQAAEKETAKFIEVSQAILQKHSEFLTKIEKARRAVQVSAQPPAPAPTKEEQIAAAASQIGSAMDKLTADGNPPASAAPETFEQPAEPSLSANTEQPAESGFSADYEPAAEMPVPDDYAEPTMRVPVPDDYAEQTTRVHIPADYAESDTVRIPADYAEADTVHIPADYDEPAAPPQQGSEQETGPVYDDEGEPTKLYHINKDDGSGSPRPKFDFENLKFGANFSSED